MAYVTDHFNRADTSTTLGTAESGQAWSTSGNFRIRNQKAQCTVGGFPGMATVLCNRDSVIESTLVTGDSNQGLVVRASSTSGGRCVLVTRTEILLRDFGTPVSKATHSSSFSDGDRMRVTTSGCTIRVYKNGTQVSSWKDLTNSSPASRVGLLYNGASPPFTQEWDDVNVASEGDAGWTVGRIGVTGGAGSPAPELPPLHTHKSSSANSSSSGAQTLTLAEPFPAADGDIELAVVVLDTTFGTVSGPGDWTERSRVNSNGIEITVWSKVRSGSSSAVFSASVDPPAGQFAMSGVRLINDKGSFDSSAVSISGSGNPIVCPSLSPSGTGRDLYNIACNKSGGSAPVPSDGIEWVGGIFGGFVESFGCVALPSSSASGTRDWEDANGGSMNPRGGVSILVY